MQTKQSAIMSPIRVGNLYTYKSEDTDDLSHWPMDYLTLNVTIKTQATKESVNFRSL